MKTLLIIYLLALSILGNAQELKRITKSKMAFGEIYYVLKSNKSIKQGQYLKYYEAMHKEDKAVEAFGSYYNNKRTSAWIFCNPDLASNPLISIGEYKDDKKNGSWMFFYVPELEKNIIINNSENTKHTKVELPTKDNEQFSITLDTIGLRIAATGLYVDNKKVGVWNYYYKNGMLACKYDFSSRIMTQNNGLVNYEQLLGIERFKELFGKSAYEMRVIEHPFFSENSSVVFELTTFHDNLEVKLIISNGSETFAKAMEEILVNMPLDWISYDPRLEENKIKIQINYIVQGNIGKIMLDSIKPFK